jgi:catechol 2,3-dioxygenase-like lactoylglutathione lyase family enzyme
MVIYAFDHVQIAMPPGEEQQARRFYGAVLGMQETPKPDSLARRGGVWFDAGDVRLHLGVEAAFRPTRKAHPAFLVHDLAAIIARCRAAGIEPVADVPLPGYL